LPQNADARFRGAKDPLGQETVCTGCESLAQMFLTADHKKIKRITARSSTTVQFEKGSAIFFKKI
jgi:hypothetical protein